MACVACHVNMRAARIRSASTLGPTARRGFPAVNGSGVRSYCWECVPRGGVTQQVRSGRAPGPWSGLRAPRYACRTIPTLPTAPLSARRASLGKDRPSNTVTAGRPPRASAAVPAWRLEGSRRRFIIIVLQESTGLRAAVLQKHQSCCR